MEEGNFIQLNEDYRIRSDGSLNIILMKKVPKRNGKGRYAEIIPNEYNYDDIGYYGTLENLVKALIRHEQLKAVQEVDSLEKVVSYIKEVERSIIKHLNEKVTLVRK